MWRIAPPAALRLYARLLVLLAAISGAPQAIGGLILWDGDTSSDFESGSNWGGGTAPANDLVTDTAVFDAKGASADPSLSTSRSIYGVSFTDGEWTLGGSPYVLTVSDGGVSCSAASGAVSIAAIIGGTGGVTKTGAGTLILSGGNTFTGDTTLGGGVLQAKGAHAGTLGTGVSRLILNGGTLASYADTAGTINYGRDVTVAADVALKYGRLTAGTGHAGTRQFGALEIGDAKLTASLDLTPDNYSSLDVSATLTFSSTTLTGDAAIDIYGLMKRWASNYLNLGSVTDGGGGHDLTLRGQWYYTKYSVTGLPTLGGDLILNGGTMLLNNGADSTVSSVAGNIKLTGGGVLGLTGDFTRPLGDGPGQIQLTGSGYNGFTANGNSDVVVTLTDPATGHPAQLKWGTGFFYGSGLSIAVGGAGNSSQIELVNPIDLNGSTRRFLNYVSGLNRLSGLITNSSTTATAGIETNTNATATLYLTNNENTFDGPITFSGTLRFDSIADADSTPSALGAPKNAATGLISLGSSGTKGTLLYTGSGDSSTDRMIKLASTTADCRITANDAGTIRFTNTGTMPTPGAGTKTLFLEGTNTGDNLFAIGIIDNSSINITSLKKDGAGKWILAGANTYTGITTVSAGELLVNGTHIGGGDYTVAATATLGGNGVIGASSNVAVSGTLAPGGSLGTLTVEGNLVTNNGAIYEWQLADGAQDLIAVGGNLTVNDTLTIVLQDAGVGMVAETNTFDLFTYGGTLSLGNVVIDDQWVTGLPGWDTSNIAIGFDGDSVFLTGPGRCPRTLHTHSLDPRPACRPRPAKAEKALHRVRRRLLDTHYGWSLNSKSSSIVFLASVGIVTVTSIARAFYGGD